MNRMIMIMLMMNLILHGTSQDFNPVAAPESVVVSGNARFTILTSRVIRLEWAEDGKFEDHASLTFINRLLPVPEFSSKEENGWLEIYTSDLVLKYRAGSGQFATDNLSIIFHGQTGEIKWYPGLENKGNLLGTYRTLDGFDGDYSTYGKKPMELEPGLISKDGWTLIDDSSRPLFDNSDWPWVMPRPQKKLQDFYFFGYGRDYKDALHQFTLLAGKIPIPPKFAFGIWWSRYWAYTDQEYKNLVTEYETHDLPLDVLVIDMDWHIVDRKEWYNAKGEKGVDQAGEWAGWTGLTWNDKYFPDPEGFLKWTNNKGLKTCLNLHPASGVQPHEKAYPEFARAMGTDPATKKYVPFDIVDKKFAKNYFDLVLNPMQKMGVDFWWLDWQQWSTTKLEGVNPTFYLNYVFFSKMQLYDTVRPMIFHRYGGLGNHRYQIGFSGDVRISWASLTYQPIFTATASNVCYGYWSHDIGGHFKADVDERTNPELFTRWVQWGSLSPIFRTHCTKDPMIERRMWAYPVKYYYAMRDAVKFRYSLFPYIYTSAYKAYETGISLIRPMYYDHPDEDNAYNFKGQYMFGDDLLVSPITHPLGKYVDGRDSLITYQKIWLPEGTWIEWNSGSILEGGKIIIRQFTLAEIPIYAKAGAIIPMQPEMEQIGSQPIDPLILNIFPGKSGNAIIYNDRGNDQEYLAGKFSLTMVSFAQEDKSMNIKIGPIEGKYDGMPETRAYELRLWLQFPPEEVKVNGNQALFGIKSSDNSWTYDGNKLMVVIHTASFNVNDQVSIKVTLSQDGSSLLSGKPGMISRMTEASRLIHSLEWPYNGQFLLEDIVYASQTGDRMTIDPRTVQLVAALAKLDKDVPTIIQAILNTKDKRYIPVIDLLKSLNEK